jgi:predicted naringenin-chalcone synthase
MKKGYRAHIGKDVPIHSVSAIPPMLKKMIPSFVRSMGVEAPSASLRVQDFDWAIHPGGKAILKGAQQAMNISDEQLRASYKVYTTRGNTASVTILSVLDRLRNMGEGKNNVVACSFGPGMICEMAGLRRCRR